MGLLTLFFLICFTLVYLSKAWDEKPGFIAKVTDKISENLETISLWGMIYGFAAVLLTLIMAYTPGHLVIRVIANALIVLMALPYAQDRVMAKLQGKVNPAILDEVRSFAGWITARERMVGYAGAAFSLILFGAIFR